MAFNNFNVLFDNIFFKNAKCINLFLNHDSDEILLKEQENIFIAVIKEDGKNVIIIKMASWIL